MIDSYLNEVSHWPVWGQVVAGVVLGLAILKFSRPWLALGDLLAAKADLAKAKAKRIASRQEPL